MSTAVTLAEIKNWLKLPAAEDEALDAQLTGLLTAACDELHDITGLVLCGDEIESAPERVKAAIQFRVASWFENPVPDAASEDAARKVVDSLVAKYRKISYPADE